MKKGKLIRALRRVKVETGSIVCMGCGHEHGCSVHGCAIINEAIAQLQIADNSEPVPKELKRAVQSIVKWFEKAQNLKFVRKPVEYALYHAWREMDGENDERAERKAD